MKLCNGTFMRKYQSMAPVLKICLPWARFGEVQLGAPSNCVVVLNGIRLVTSLREVEVFNNPVTFIHGSNLYRSMPYIM